MNSQQILDAAKLTAGMSAAELPPPPPFADIEAALNEALRQVEQSARAKCLAQPVSIPLQLSFVDSMPLAADSIPTFSEPSMHSVCSSGITIPLRVNDQKSLVACEEPSRPLLVASDEIDGTECSLSVMRIGNGLAALRVSGRKVADGLRPTLICDGTELTGLNFGPYAFCNASDSVLDRIGIRRIGPSPKLAIRFEDFFVDNPAERAILWSSWGKFIDDANKGVDWFIEVLDTIAASSVDLVALSGWCKLVRTNVLERWLFSGRFASAAAESAFGAHLLGPILAIILRRRVQLVRVERKPQALEVFWNGMCQLLGVPRASQYLSNQVCRDLVFQSNAIKEVADDERQFALKAGQIASEIASSELPLTWAADVFSRLSQERSSDVALNGGTAAKVVTVWEDLVVGESAAQVIREGYILEFEYCLPQKENSGFGKELSSDFLDVVKKHQETGYRGIALRPKPDPIRQLLGQGTVRGKSGSLALITALRLAGQPSKDGVIQSIPDFAIATAAEKDGIVGAVGGLSRKLELLKEEGVRVVCVPASQLKVAMRYASEGMHVVSAAKSQDFSQQLVEAGLLRPIKDMRSYRWYSRREAIALVALAPFGFGFLGWSLSRRFAWQTAAVAYHKEQGFDHFENLSARIFDAKENAGGAISLPALMIALGILGDGDRIGVDPMIVGTAIERLTSKSQETKSGFKLLTEAPRDAVVSIINAKDFAFATERETFMSALALNLGVDRDRLEVRLAPNVDYKSDGISIVNYDGKVFDHVGRDGETLWRSASRDGLESERAIKTNPTELAYFTRVMDVSTIAREIESAYISFELNTSGFGVIPITKVDDSVDLFIKCMPQSQWCPLAGMDDLGDISMSITTMVRRPLTNASPGKSTRTAIQAIYVNAYQDQSLRNADSDWWGGRFNRGTVRGDLAVGFPATAASGPCGGDATEPESKFEFASKESDKPEPVRKRLFHDGARDWIVMDEFNAAGIWDKDKDAIAFVQRFRATWDLSFPPND